MPAGGGAALYEAAEGAAALYDEPLGMGMGMGACGCSAREGGTNAGPPWAPPRSPAPWLRP